jgi:excisionase family DNA binding protein
MKQQFELFPEIVGLKKPSRVQVGEMYEIVKERGGLLPTGEAAKMLKVSRQRLFELIGEGRIEALNFLGRKWVCEDDLLKFANSSRSPGRPKKIP